MVINPAHTVDDSGERLRVRPSHGHVLPAGTRLRDYEITGLIDEGGFGIVYLAWDHSLQRKVAIKEYMPASMASRVAGSSAIVVKSERHIDTFKAGLKSFVNEARLLARFDHASLVKVYRFWEENGTAYMVMPFYEGPTLKTALAGLDHVPSEAELRTWLKPVLDAVALLHDGRLWHQNIAPDGIVLTPIGPVLFGFGSAEHAVAALNHAPAAALKPGFAAIEQYGSAAETTRGAWTDLYALAAVVYTAIIGSAPAAAADRLVEDPVQPLSAVAAGLYSKGFLAAIDAALAVEPERRPRDHLQFRSLMGDIDAAEPVALTPPHDLMHEPFAGQKSVEREITIPDRPLMSLGAPAAKASAAVAPTAVSATKPASREPANAAVRASTDDMRPRPALHSPSWMRSGAARRVFGTRTLYALVAGIGALIGVAVLASQFYARQADHASKATAVIAESAHVTAVASPPPLRPASAAPLVAAPAPPEDLTPPGTEAERQTRCTGVLQKASLEPITRADTDFFKRECK